LHAAQIQGFFDIPVDHLSAAKVFHEYFDSNRDQLKDLVIVSPDVGNVKVANQFASMLDADLAIVDKRRESGMKVASRNLIGNVKGRSVLMIDDMISTAGTVCEAARLVMEYGATSVHAAATHAVFAGIAAERLNEAPISSVIVTDSIPIGTRMGTIQHKLTVLTVAKLLGDAVHRIHHDMSISALFRGSLGTKR
ncbi:MAG: ribose-phosphate diphosphokinase, partial [Phycisphaerales bacterium]|nr:ribose-phosphate diphosphokinase [Phycisphaerales bacterium]